MEVVLDPVQWTDGEAYRVTVGVDKDRPGGSLVVGCAWRANGDPQWSFGHEEQFNPNTDNFMKFDAADREAVHAEMVKRFRVVQLPRDRLDDSRMDEVTSGSLNVIAALARVTGSEGGYSNALISAVSRFAVTSIKPEADEEFILRVGDSLRERIKEMRAFIAETDGMTEQLAQILAKRMDREPTKH